MFAEVDPIWKEAFALAWDAFRRGNVPVGCVVAHGPDIVARGQNGIYDEPSITPLAGTDLAHAEMVALSKLRKREHSISEYTLYTTMEPCPMCFGSIVMVGIQQVRYAARDGWAGSAALSTATPYLSLKKMNFVLEGGPLEAFQIALSTAFELRRGHPNRGLLLDSWHAHSPEGVRVGTVLFEQGYFAAAVRDGSKVEQVYAEVVANLADKSRAEPAGALCEEE